MLVVIAIILVMMAILLPVLRTVKITTHRLACAAQVKQITMGILIIADENDGKFPPHNSNPNDVSTGLFNFKPMLRAVVPVVNTFYCPSSWVKGSYLVDNWDNPAWNNLQHPMDYPIYFNAVGVAFTLRTSIDEVEHPSSEVLMGDIAIGSQVLIDPVYAGHFTPNKPFIGNHPLGYECVNGSCPGGYGFPVAGANWGAYDGHVQWRHAKILRYLGGGGAGPWQWYN